MKILLHTQPSVLFLSFTNQFFHMKKPASPNQTEKRAKRTPEEKTARKSAKNAGRAASDLKDDRADKKSSQKKSLKSAAKQLQKELNNRMNEVVIRIRKETKAKLKEVVKEATRRLDGDTERMFEQALHTIVRHYDSVAGNTSSPADNSSEANKSKGKTARAGKKALTLNKDGSPRKARALRAEADALETVTPMAATATTTSGRRPATAKASAAGTKRGPKAGPPATGAKRGPKPRTQSAPKSTDGLNVADSTGEASE